MRVRSKRSSTISRQASPENSSAAAGSAGAVSSANADVLGSADGTARQSKAPEACVRPTGCANGCTVPSLMTVSSKHLNVNENYSLFAVNAQTIVFAPKKTPSKYLLLRNASAEISQARETQSRPIHENGRPCSALILSALLRPYPTVPWAALSLVPGLRPAFRVRFRFYSAAGHDRSAKALWYRSELRATAQPSFP